MFLETRSEGDGGVLYHIRGRVKAEEFESRPAKEPICTVGRGRLARVLRLNALECVRMGPRSVDPLKWKMCDLLEPPISISARTATNLINDYPLRPADVNKNRYS